MNEADDNDGAMPNESDGDESSVSWEESHDSTERMVRTWS